MFASAFPLFLSSAQKSAAETEYFIVGKRAFASWRCAALASYLPDQRARALMLYDQGREDLFYFLKGLEAGIITDADREDMPVGILELVNKNATVDFQLGYMWAVFQDRVKDEIALTPDEQNSSDPDLTLESKASLSFLTENCVLILPRPERATAP